MTTPLLSLVLCSRNDAYMGNSRWRLETTLNYIARRLEAIGRSSDVEVLVTDWGSDVPLRDEVSLVPAARDLVSFVTVPRPLARRLQRDSPFPEVLALNAAVRRARGAYVGRIDQDTLVGERFLRWFFAAAACAETTRTLYLLQPTRHSVSHRGRLPASPRSRGADQCLRELASRLARPGSHRQHLLDGQCWDLAGAPRHLGVLRRIRRAPDLLQLDGG